jgi:hypothetical protein
MTYRRLQATMTIPGRRVNTGLQVGVPSDQYGSRMKLAYAVMQLAVMLTDRRY